MSGIRSALILILALCVPASAQELKPRYAGPTQAGFLLPNGWMLTPAGRQVAITDMPLNILATPDGDLALVATDGYNAHELSLVDLKTGEVVSKISRPQSWFGLAVDATIGTIWWSGGGDNSLTTISRDGRTLSLISGPQATDPKDKERAKGHFRSGLALHPNGEVLYTLDIADGTISAFAFVPDPETITAPAGKRPYDVKTSPDGSKVYVSDWAGKAVRVLDPRTLATVATIAVGEHPNQMAVHPDDGRVFVACASSNSVSVIDGKLPSVIETISTSLFPLAPEGSTPCALALSPEGETLFVANADNNCVAVIDVSTPLKSEVEGFIPTGWYPSALAVTPDGDHLLVGVGKGNQTRPNPISPAGPKPDPAASKPKGLAFPYIGTTLSGSLSIVPIPNPRQLAAYTEAVYKNCPYSDSQITVAPHPRKTAIPTRVGEPSPIKHVIYIIKENRTYDQVFGDVKKGNGDPSLCMFPEEVTPNHHRLAEEFVLLDNLYCNGHVSADGHPWSTMAYGTDYVARNWALTYSGRVGVPDDDDGDLQKAPSGYIWDECRDAGLTYRSYGEYGRRVSQPDGSFKMEGAVPGLVGHFCADWGTPRADKAPVRDTHRVETFLKEFRQYEKDGSLPRFIVMSLGEDHTTGTTPGTFTPRACVASNDLALGTLVEAVSRSRYWPETVIFVIEDDAQNGPDHVDAHRTVGLVISAYTRRHHVDHTQYGTVSMLRTMELILGLKPLSQFDAAANPMFGCFEAEPNLSPFAHENARISLVEVNTKLAYGAERSSKMDFSEYDKIDDFELNEILWRSIRGADAPIPPSVRRAIAHRGPSATGSSAKDSKAIDDSTGNTR